MLGNLSNHVAVGVHVSGVNLVHVPAPRPRRDSESSHVRVSITDIVDQPGATRPVEVDVPATEFGSDPWGTAEGAVRDPIELDLHLDSVVDGILVRGSLVFHLELVCARCLEPQQTVREVSVAELFLDPAKRIDEEDEDEPGYELIDDATAIELSTMVRDALIIDLPVRTLCREDCQGLCPTCGADRNRTDCGHQRDEGIDPRWAALADLELPND